MPIGPASTQRYKKASNRTGGRFVPSERGYVLLYQVEADQLW